MDQIEIRTWNIPELDGSTIKVATIEQGPRKPSPLCEGCPAPCCRGLYCVPVLNADEFINHKFAFHYVPLPKEFSEENIKADYLVVLGEGEGVCPYFDLDKWKCKVWPDCPASCKAYDCREDPRPEIMEFVEHWSKDRKNKERLPWQAKFIQT